MIKKLGIILLLILALVLPIQGVFAVFCGGGAPDAFYGTLKINGVNASADTQMRAKILGDLRGFYNTSAAGRYGNAQGINKFQVFGVTEGYVEPQNITFEVFANDQWKQAVLNGSLNSWPYTCGTIYNVNMSVTVGCVDSDSDGVCNDADNCINNANSNQANSDGDSFGDACDACPLDSLNDADGDNVCGNVDNCPGISNSNQANADGDSTGDACDPCTDVDQDTSCNNVDCNDTNSSINPNADEDCDGVDNDCNGNTADGSGDPQLAQETFFLHF